MTTNLLRKLANSTKLPLSQALTPKMATLSCLALACVISFPTHAESGSVHHSGQASKHSTLAVSHGLGSSAKVASAVVATPIIAVGGASLATGASAVSIGGSIANSANNVSAHHQANSHPLVITDIVITADPAPNQAIQTINSNSSEKTTSETTITTTKVKETTIKNR